jgi:hypothetical protein
MKLTHNINCERADDRVLTQPILDKINDLIRDADLIIADCTGHNANVFYELGIAHAQGKKVILITSDPVRDAPSDVRHFEFIPYELDQHDAFLSRLDNALKQIIFEKYKDLYELAVAELQDFARARSIPVEQASRDEFVSRVRSAERIREIPPRNDPRAIIGFVMPNIVAETVDADLMGEIRNWLEQRTGRRRKRR